MKTINRSDKLRGVCYDIRGPVLQKAKQLEDEGVWPVSKFTGNGGNNERRKNSYTYI